MHQNKLPVMMKILQLNRQKTIYQMKMKRKTLMFFFVNIASMLKEPIEHNDFSILREHINSKITENMHFELPDIDEPFVFKFLSALDVLKSADLVGIGVPDIKKIEYSTYHVTLFVR